MFDKTKVVLIGCVACSGVFLDTFSAVWADPVPIEKTELMAPLPVRFMSKVSLDLVKPVPRDPRLPPRESPPPLFTPDPLARMMSDLSGRLREHWKKHEGKHEQIIVLFHLHKDGSVTNLKVQKSSGSNDTDDEAVRAVRGACRFLKLPPSFEEDGYDMQFTFSDSMFYSSRRTSDPVGGYSAYAKARGRVEF